MIHLRPTELRTLRALQSCAPRWVDTYAILDAVAPGRDVKNVHVHVCRLRHKLGSAIEIHNGRNRYRLVRCEVQAA